MFFVHHLPFPRLNGQAEVCENLLRIGAPRFTRSLAHLPCDPAAAVKATARLGKREKASYRNSQTSQMCGRKVDNAKKRFSQFKQQGRFMKIS